MGVWPYVPCWQELEARVKELERAEALLQERNDLVADMRIQLAAAKSDILELHEQLDKVAPVGRSGMLSPSAASLRTPTHAVRSPASGGAR